MAFSDRCDGVFLRKLPSFRKMFPYLMRTRTESAIYYTQRIKLRHTLSWLEKVNAGRARRISLFHVVLAAIVRTLALRPDANRFVSGRRIYQRRTIDLSFVIKRELSEEAAETTVKITFDPRSTITEVSGQIASVVQATKAGSTSRDEGTADLVAKLPRSGIRLVVWALRTLDYFRLLPASFIKGDALYASVFVANLGSIGLDAVFHHMYEWGNAVFFIVVGKRKKEPVVNDRGELEVQEIMDMNISLDERIMDGVNYAKTIGLLTELIEKPELLETPPADIPDPFALA